MHGWLLNWSTRQMMLIVILHFAQLLLMSGLRRLKQSSLVSNRLFLSSNHFEQVLNADLCRRSHQRRSRLVTLTESVLSALLVNDAIKDLLETTKELPIEIVEYRDGHRRNILLSITHVSKVFLYSASPLESRSVANAS
jgi:hypothetical protein